MESNKLHLDAAKSERQSEISDVDRCDKPQDLRRYAEKTGEKIICVKVWPMKLVQYFVANHPNRAGINPLGN